MTYRSNSRGEKERERESEGDPPSERLVQCLAKNYKNDSIVSVDMDKVGVMAAYCDLLCVRVVHCI